MPEQSAFGSTRWSLVARAADPGAAEARAALAELCQAYWWPLYAYLRRIGLGADDAADTVQGFFAELIEKRSFARADPARGRFRGWLLAALKHHLSHERERQRAEKRGGRARILALDPHDADRRWGELARDDQDPEHLYERAWALAVIANALCTLRAAYARAGKEERFAALEPVLLGGAEHRLDEIGHRLGLSPSAVKSAAHRLRQDLRAAIRTELASTLDDRRDLEDELRILFTVVGAPLRRDSAQPRPAFP